ncbi:MAG: hypothetical protein HY097_09695 [Nitrospinae bacterium]|nr:hypothetical protein [Nitrospinota bacterium]MBI3814121.1 hypothetical protein [Nitrospinota bacterium]
MSEHEIIKTKIFRSSEKFILQRAQRIAEAIAFEGGTIENPKRHLISTLPNGKESYFLKPGKETQRAIPNIHDMFPNVGISNKSETEGYTFEIIWEYLIKISIINQRIFKKVLVLLYRLCFLIDHKEIEEGKIRYSPSEKMLDYIGKIDFAIKEGFKDKFKKDGIGLLEFLHFIDILGWNEDVKYHIKNSKPDFEDKSKRKIGRVNTILSVISVPIMISKFILKLHIHTMNVKLILSTYLKSNRPKNTWEITDRELIKDLSPHLIAT